MFKSRHVIVGGGITGLTLAWQLQRRYGNHIHLTLLEKEPRLGGYLHTDCYGGGDFLFERGPHSCRAYGGGEAALELIEALGASDDLLYANTHANQRYLYLHQKLHALPKMPLKWLLSSVTRSLIPSLLTEWTVPPQRHHAEETVHEWALRRFGKGVAERLFDPLMRGIFAGDSRTLSMEACLPLLITQERTYGSLTRAMLSEFFKKPAANNTVKGPKKHPSSIFTLRKGWGQLIERLQTLLTPTTHLRMGTKLLALRPVPSTSTVELLLEEGQRLEADFVYLTTPAHVSAAVLAHSAPETALLLSSIPFVNVLIAHVGFHTSVLPYRGFGHLVPTWEDQDLLGMVWDSSLFPEQNRHPQQTRLTVMLRGGVHDPEKTVQEALSQHLGITAKPDVLQFHDLHQAIAQYTLGHITRVKRAKETLHQSMPQVQLLGSSFDGISLPSSIVQAREVAWN